MAASERATSAWNQFVALAEGSSSPHDLEQLCEFLVAAHLDGQPVSYWACEKDMAKFAEGQAGNARPHTERRTCFGRSTSLAPKSRTRARGALGQYPSLRYARVVAQLTTRVTRCDGRVEPVR